MDTCICFALFRMKLCYIQFIFFNITQMKNIYLGKKVISAVNFIRRVLETVQPVKTIKKKKLMYSDHNVIEIFPG